MRRENFSLVYGHLWSHAEVLELILDILFKKSWLNLELCKKSDGRLAK